MSAVWVVNSGVHKYDAASRFGSIQNLTTGTVNVFALDRVLVDLKDKLSTSNPDDWLLLSGPIPLNIMAAVEFMRKHGKLNLLLFDLRTKEYKQRQITMDDFDKEVARTSGCSIESIIK